MRAADVKALPIGSRVLLWPDGSGPPTICTVAFRGRPDNKFLTWRDGGQIKKFAIRDYPGMHYSPVKGGEGHG